MLAVKFLKISLALGVDTQLQLEDHSMLDFEASKIWDVLRIRPSSIVRLILPVQLGRYSCPAGDSRKYRRPSSTRIPIILASMASSLGVQRPFIERQNVS